MQLPMKTPKNGSIPVPMDLVIGAPNPFRFKALFPKGVPCNNFTKEVCACSNTSIHCSLIGRL